MHVGHQGLPSRRERTHVRDLGRIPKATKQIAFVQQSQVVRLCSTDRLKATPKLSVALIYSLILLDHRCSEVMSVSSLMELGGGEEFGAVRIVSSSFWII